MIVVDNKQIKLQIWDTPTKPMTTIGASKLCLTRNGADWEVDPSELQLLEKVGTGCTAEVYRGTWNAKTVAIKQISYNMSRLGQREQRLLDREISIMQSA